MKSFKIIVASLLFASSHLNYDGNPLTNPLSDVKNATGLQVTNVDGSAEVSKRWSNITEPKCPAQLAPRQLQRVCHAPGALKVQVFCHVVRRSTTRAIMSGECDSLMGWSPEELLSSCDDTFDAYEMTCPISIGTIHHLIWLTRIIDLVVGVVPHTVKIFLLGLMIPFLLSVGRIEGYFHDPAVETIEDVTWRYKHAIYKLVLFVQMSRIRGEYEDKAEDFVNQLAEASDFVKEFNSNLTRLIDLLNQTRQDYLGYQYQDIVGNWEGPLTLSLGLFLLIYACLGLVTTIGYLPSLRPNARKDQRITLALGLFFSWPIFGLLSLGQCLYRLIMTRYPRPNVSVRDEFHRPRPHCQAPRDSLSSSSSAGTNVAPEHLHSSHGKEDSARQPVSAARAPTRPTKLSQRSRDSKSSLVKGPVPLVPEPGIEGEATPINPKVDAALTKPSVVKRNKPQWGGPDVDVEPTRLEHRPTASVQGQCRQDLSVSQRLNDQGFKQTCAYPDKAYSTPPPGYTPYPEGPLPTQTKGQSVDGNPCGGSNSEGSFVPNPNSTACKKVSMNVSPLGATRGSYTRGRGRVPSVTSCRGSRGTFPSRGTGRVAQPYYYEARPHSAFTPVERPKKMSSLTEGSEPSMGASSDFDGYQPTAPNLSPSQSSLSSREGSRKPFIPSSSPLVTKYLPVANKPSDIGNVNGDDQLDFDDEGVNYPFESLFGGDADETKDDVTDKVSMSSLDDKKLNKAEVAGGLEDVVTKGHGGIDPKTSPAAASSVLNQSFNSLAA